MKKDKVTFAVIGAGSRGLYSYPPYIAAHRDQASIVAVAEPRDFNRNKIVSEFDVPTENIFTDYKDLFKKPKLADVAMITVQDALHKDVALAAAQKGYDLLLEKPMAVNPADCLAIYDAVKKYNRKLCVCHVLRYNKVFMKIKEIIDSGAIGEIATIQHTEGVGWWHQAHSYVRGDWSNEAKSSFMLLAKSCHDIDLINWWIGKKCKSVASFGHLKHFKKENKPLNATSRCWDCPLADGKCSYSAKTFYLNSFDSGCRTWPISVLINDYKKDNLIDALKHGPYGRCVYECDNDVVDNQVVTMDFEGGTTVNFTMTAFMQIGRQTKIMGTDGYIEADEESLKVLDFKTKKWDRIDFDSTSSDVADGHGGGDFGLMESFIGYMSGKEGYVNKTGADESLQSHLITFAAEKARRENKVIIMDEYLEELRR